MLRTLLQNAASVITNASLLQNASEKPNSPTDQAEAVCAIDKCISDLRKWMYQDKIKINDDKTEFLIIGSRYQLLKINPCTVRV